MSQEISLPRMALGELVHFAIGTVVVDVVVEVEVVVVDVLVDVVDVVDAEGRVVRLLGRTSVRPPTVIV